MMELVKMGFDALADLVVKWVKAGPEERLELEKRAASGIAVMKGERKLTHETLDAANAETQRIIDEAKAKQAKAAASSDETTKP